MPFIIPSKRSSISKSTRFSRYQDVEESQHFLLQKRKSKRVSSKRRMRLRPPYRIITRGSYPYYQVAYGLTLEELETREWKYIIMDLPEVLPTYLDRNARMKWLIAHFTQLALETDNGHEKGDDTEDSEDDILDEEEEAKLEKEAQNNSSRSQERNKMKGSGAESDSEPTTGASRVRMDPGLNKRVTGQSESTSIRSRAESRPRVRSGASEQKTYPLDTSAVQALQLASDGYILRGSTVYLFLLFVVNVSSLLLRDISYASYFLGMLVANMFLYFTIMRGDPFSLSFQILGRHADLQKRRKTNRARSSRPKRDMKGSSSKDSAPGDVDFHDDIVHDESDENQMEDSAEDETEDSIGGGELSGVKVPINITGINYGVITDPGDGATPNTWDKCEASSFNVRIPPNYKRNKLKGPSDQEFFYCVGVDVFSSKSKVDHIAQYIDLPKCPVRKDDDPNPPDLGGFKTEGEGTDGSAPAADGAEVQYQDDEPVNGIPKWLIINWQIPSYAPSMNPFGPTVDDGEGWSMVFYFRLTEYGIREIEKQETTASQLLKRYWDSEPDDKLKDRLKSITRLADPEVMDFGRTLKRLIRTYNGKPFLTEPCHVFYKNDLYMEFDIDAHRFCFLARKVAFQLKDSLAYLVIESAFVIEGWGDEEQPEQLLNCVRVSKIDQNIAKPLSHWMKLVLEKNGGAVADPDAKEKSASQKADGEAPAPSPNNTETVSEYPDEGASSTTAPCTATGTAAATATPVKAEEVNGKAPSESNLEPQTTNGVDGESTETPKATGSNGEVE